MPTTPFPPPEVAALRRLLRQLTAVLVIVAVGALTFTAANVRALAVAHGVSTEIAWMLDPLVGVALGAVLLADGALLVHNVVPGGWALGLRWFAGGATWLMNIWSSLWPLHAAWGVPVHTDPAGVVLHSVPPVLLIVLAEAISRYRLSIQARIRELEGDGRVVTPVSGGESTPLPAPSVPVTPVSAPPLPPTPEPEPEPVDAEEETPRLSTEDAARVIAECWRDGLSIRETAARATRSPSYVHKQFGELAAAAIDSDESDDSGEVAA